MWIWREKNGCNFQSIVFSTKWEYDKKYMEYSSFCYIWLTQGHKISLDVQKYIWK